MEQMTIKSYSKDLKICEEVALGQNLFLTAFERWSGEKAYNNLIKVMLPSDKDTALKMCLNGITIDNIEYIGYLANPNMQKQENNYYIKNDESYDFIDNVIIKNESYDKITEICEMWFIRKDKTDFIEWFENLISLGTFKEKFENETLCINKKITSRIALTMSGTTKINYKPKIAIVKEEEILLHKDIIYYTYQEDKLVENKEDNYLIKNTLFDGFGLLSNRLAEQIKKDMNINHNVDFAILRLYGLQVKGLCIRWDWNDYLEKYCDSQFIINDYYENPIDLRDVDLILTPSQVKWVDNFTSIDDYYEKLNATDEKYKDLVDCVYVTKVNHPKNKVKEYTLANYQFISNLNLNYDDLIKLSESTIDLYNKVLDFDLANLLYILKEFDDDEEYKLITDKINYLIQVNSNFLKSEYVISNIKKFIINKIALLSSTKMYLKGNYKLICSNPFLLINKALGIDGESTLDENEFYIPNNCNKKFVISRNPIANPWELQKIETVNNKLFDEYFKDYSEEIIFINNKDYTLNRLSNADIDGDGILCIENDIVYNTVLNTDRVFCHMAEGQTVEMLYNNENKIKALLDSAGNLIGKIAIASTKVNNQILSISNNKQEIIKQFDKYKDYLLYLTEISQLVIDAPKTLKMPDKKALEPIDCITKMTRPLFMRFKDGYKKGCEREYYLKLKAENKGKQYQLPEVHSHLDKFSKYIQDTLLKKCEELNKQGTKDTIVKTLFNDTVNIDEKCLEEINDLSALVSKNAKNYKNDVDKYRALKDTYILVANDISNRYDYQVICNCLATKTDRFAIDYFFNDIVDRLNDLDFNNGFSLKCADGLTTIYDNTRTSIMNHDYVLVDREVRTSNIQAEEINKIKTKYNKKGKIGIVNVGKVEEDLQGEYKVIIDDRGIALLKEDIKVTFAYSDIKDINKKKTNDTLFTCSVINVLDVIDRTNACMKLKIEY